MPRIRIFPTLLAAACALAGAAPATAAAAPLDRAVARELARAGGVSGGYVLDTTTGRVLASVRADVRRIPASVQKLYTGAAALLRFGADGTIGTRVLGAGALEDDGTWRGDLYLRGAGDPTFGSTTFTRRYGVGATVDELAADLRAAGVRRVTGRVYGDESAFDLLRGGPASNWGYDVWIGGPLSGLMFNRGLAREDGRALQQRPATFAAKQLVAALRRQRIRVAAKVGERPAPAGAQELAVAASPPMATLVRMTLVPSDNLIAEMLLKALGAHHGRAGTTRAGATVVRRTLARFRIAPRISDGSGLSRANATSPRQVVALLDGMRDAEGFRDGLAVAGRTGTLANRMRTTAARDRCVGKTGSLSNVSTLAGYCRTANDHLVAFAFMHNRVVPAYARSAQDRLLTTLARSRPAGAPAARTGRPQQQPASPATTPAPSRSGGATVATR